MAAIGLLAVPASKMAIAMSEFNMMKNFQHKTTHQFHKSNLQHFEVDTTLLNILPDDLIKRYQILPIHHNEQELHLATSKSFQSDFKSTIKFHTGKQIVLQMANENDLLNAIEHYFEIKSSYHKNSRLSSIQLVANESIDIDHDNLIINYVEELLDFAIKHQISDIHLEPHYEKSKIRCRRDGLLREHDTLSPDAFERVIARLKIIAQMDIAEKRLPQDGRISLEHSQKIDIRASTCPTINGEKMVLRLFNACSHRHISSLGLHPIQEQILLNSLQNPHGMILVTGPTGSGKSLTLYTVLHFLNQQSRNIVTIEDPVEMKIAGINQINVNSRIGLSFANLLRSLLRQDPDVIMVGEIRDAETASIALQAAQTGHLVFSTLHANNTIQAVSRLRSLGIPDYQLSDSLILIIAQRLIRKLCTQCNTPNHQINYPPSNADTRSRGCTHCDNGYHERTGIFELLPFNDINFSSLHKEVNNKLCLSLYDAGLEKIRSGVTDFLELSRVINTTQAN